jgi:Na+-driven multidrug efflux pump
MLMWQISIFSNKSNFIHFKKGTFRLKRKIVVDSLSIGIAPFLMNAVSCVIVILINQALIKYGSDLHVGAYGIINRMAFLFAMIVMGLNQGMQPIAGYNFGAGQIDRVTKVLKYTIGLGTAVMTLGFLISMFFPHAVASVFTSDKTLIDIAVPGLRTVFMFFPIIGFQMVTSNFFQSIGMAKKAIFMSLSRQLIFLLPCLLILPQFLGVKGVWFSLPVADFLSSLIAVYMLAVQYRKSVLKHELKS